MENAEPAKSNVYQGPNICQAVCWSPDMHVSILSMLWDLEDEEPEAKSGSRSWGSRCQLLRGGARIWAQLCLTGSHALSFTPLCPQKARKDAVSEVKK